ncbi:VWA domain-containing protein [Isoptericola sp. NPDC058082]|uniref:VWA domain-containing protein n=1 Tax=Isoptericola sp. NPDC058082 TaxID=3346331 RepID=UPI0036EA575E
MTHDVTTARTRRTSRVAAAVASLGIVGLLVAGATAPPLAGAEVPPVTTTTSVITVKTGADRQSTSEVSLLPGVGLQLRYSNQAGAAGDLVTDDWGFCTSDADGDCSFVVPQTDTATGSGGNRGRYFLVEQTGAPAGFTTNAALGTGTTASMTSLPYRFLTPAMQAGVTYSSTGAPGTTPFMVSTGAGPTASGGVWQSSRSNPPAPEQCGIDVALVTDVSGSVAGQITSLKAAATQFVGALTGTPSTMGLYTFANTAPANTSNNANVPRTPVSSATNAAALTASINGYTAGGATNWDEGLYQVVPEAAQYDMVIVLTDGNPTLWGNGQGNGSNTRFRETERGIFSANALKAAGTRVVAFGVGDGLTAEGSRQNLVAISGTVEGSDYFRTTDYAQAGAELRAIALAGCTPSISVVKQVVPPGTPDGDITGAELMPGWTFDAAFDGDAVSEGDATAVTDATGGVNFQFGFPGETGSGSVTITETLQGGFVPHPTDGDDDGTLDNAVCRDISQPGEPQVVPVESSDDGTEFTADVDQGSVLTCTVYNESPVPPASVVVDKQWSINGADPVAHGSQPSELTAGALLNGASVPWGGAGTTGFAEGDEVTVDETLGETGAGMPRFCTLTDSSVTGPGGAEGELGGSFTLDEGVNTFLVTNEVECTTQLSLVKEVRGGGPAAPEQWTLTALDPDGAEALNGTTGVEGDVIPQTLYTLTESGGDPRYAQFVDPTATPRPGSSGSWVCREIDADGNPVPGFSDGLNGGVQVFFGTHVECTAYNDTAPLRLRKAVDDSFGGTAVPGDWELTATPLGDDLPERLGPQTVTGSLTGDEVFLRPGVEYLITEDGPLGYELVDQVCRISDGGDRVGDRLFTIELVWPESADCLLTNRAVGARLTLVKEVVNDDGGTAEPEDWTLAADGPTPVTGVTGADEVTGAEVAPGDYALSEDGPAGYTSLGWTCAAEGDPLAVEDDTVTLTGGTVVTCTVANDDDAGPTPSPSPTPSVTPTPTASPSPSPSPSATPTTAPTTPPSAGPGAPGSDGGDAGPGTSGGPWGSLPVTGFGGGLLLLAVLLLVAGTVTLVVRRSRS